MSMALAFTISCCLEMENQEALCKMKIDASRSLPAVICQCEWSTEEHLWENEVNMNMLTDGKPLLF